MIAAELLVPTQIALELALLVEPQDYLDAYLLREVERRLDQLDRVAVNTEFSQLLYNAIDDYCQIVDVHIVDFCELLRAHLVTYDTQTVINQAWAIYRETLNESLDHRPLSIPNYREEIAQLLSANILDLVEFTFEVIPAIGTHRTMLQ